MHSSSEERQFKSEVNTASKQRFELKESILDAEVDPKPISIFP